MFLIVVLLSCAAKAQTADWILSNARVYTGHAGQPQADAIAVRGDSILAVGDVQRYMGPKTRVVDARGATVIAGFIDAHAHMAGLGDSLEILDLREMASAAAVARAVGQAARKTPKGEWIRGRGWDQTRWPGAGFPHAAELSRLTPNHPVYLTRIDGHAAWVNHRALQLAGVNRATPDPPGGKILRDSSGEPTGVLIDRAMALVSRHIPPPGPARLKERVERAARECARLGITSVHDAGVGQAELAAYRSLIAEGKLPVRIYAMIRGPGSLWESYLKRGPEIGPYLTVRSIKLVADGALGSRGAALKEPYADDPDNRGLLILTREQIETVARQAFQGGFQVNTHAIGDLANRAVLEAYGAVLGGANDRRFRIEHAQVVSDEDFPLFQKYSIIASVQATHATSDMRWAEARLGPRRVAGAYAWQRFLRLGVTIANGSDFPVENPNPLWGYYASITRQDHAGRPPAGWMADQRMSREQALLSWTLAGAYAAFEEKRKGTIEPGKLADLVALSKDILKVPPQEILSARVTMTVVGGKIVYQAP